MDNVVEVDEGPWRVPRIVMQWVDGRSLAEELNHDGSPDPERAAHVAEALLGTLDAAHRTGVVHRDVKPANVLLASDGSVLLADFGIAVAQTDPRLTRTALVIGSPGYTAPERWQGAESDGRADLFSLGVTLHEALEGVLPFRPENPTATLTEEPRPMERAGALAPLLLALLEKDPARRPNVDTARKLLTPSSRPPERKTKPCDQVPSAESVTVANEQGGKAGAYLQAAGKIGGYAGFGIGAVLASLTFPDPVLSLGSLGLTGDNRLGNAALGAAVLGGLLGFVCWLVGLIAGARAKSDVATLDAHGLTVSSWRGEPAEPPRGGRHPRTPWTEDLHSSVGRVGANRPRAPERDGTRCHRRVVPSGRRALCGLAHQARGRRVGG